MVGVGGGRLIWPLIPAVLTVVALFPTLPAPHLPRDATAHAFGISYAWRILTGRASDELCCHWYLCFPYTGTYGFASYYLAAPLASIFDGFRAFSVALVAAALLFAMATYLLARRLGAPEPAAAAASLLAVLGMTMEWNLGGIYPMTLSMSLGLLAHAYRHRRVVSTLLLAASLYTHPAGGALSLLTLLLRGLFERNPRDVLTVVLAVPLAAPHYDRFLRLLPTMSPLIDVPESPLELIFPLPTLYSPGLLVIIPGLLGAWRLRREHPGWTRTVLTCCTVAWAAAGLTVAGLVQHLPMGRNLLLDRLTCVWITPLLATSAYPLFSLRSESRRSLLIGLVMLGIVVAVAMLKMVTLGSACHPELRETVVSVTRSWKWAAGHRPHDPFTRVAAGPALRYLSVPENTAANALRVGPRPTGYFSQGCPHFTALIARMEWQSGSWWYVPGAPSVLTWLTNSKYLLTVSPTVARDAERHGLKLVHSEGPVMILENRRTSFAEAVDPIGVYDPNVGPERALEAYTTALVLIPYRGDRFTFAVVGDASNLRAFDRILIRPKSRRDVRTALMLARTGHRVLLVLTPHDPGLARWTARLLKISLRRAHLRLRPKDPTAMIARDRKRVGIGRPLSIHRGTATVPVYLVDGRLWRDLRVGRGTVRVSGLDPARLALTLHPVPVETPQNHWTIPLPGTRERRLLTRLLAGFTPPPPRPVPVRHRGVTDITLYPGRHRWVMVKVMELPEWRARGGRAYLGPGGVMMVRVERTPVELRYEPRRSAVSLALPIVAGMALAVRARRR